jgi:hypothetical protein
MDYLHHQFEAGPGDVIEVMLDRAANVQLLDPVNYENYRQGRTFHYEAGGMRPIRQCSCIHHSQGRGTW